MKMWRINLNRCRWIIVLGLVMILGGILFWTGSKDQGPKFKGMTARGWFEAAGRQKVNQSEVQLALEALSTNFVPVFLDFELDSSALESAKVQFYKHMPVFIQKWLPHPKSHYLLQTAAMHGMAFLGKSDPGLNRLPQLKEAFRNATENHQAMMLLLVYSYAIGQNETSVGTAARNLSHPEFLIRFYPAYYSALVSRSGGLSDTPMETNRVVSILVSGLTNSVLMEETFGKSAEAWQKRIMRELKGLAPETAATYLDAGK